MAARGFDAEFGVRQEARILCFTCRREFPADGQAADHAGRVEGESDPADMSIVVPLSCPNCGAAGTLQLQYGPQASEDEAEVLLAMQRSPDTELGAPG